MVRAPTRVHRLPGLPLPRVVAAPLHSRHSLTPHLPQTSLSLRQVRQYSSPPSFAEWVAPELARHLVQTGCSQPNEMQQRALAIGVAGGDLIVTAQTGAGKTLAFLLPLIHRLSTAPRPSCERSTAMPESLVVLPTPELAEQVARCASELASALCNPPSVARAGGPTTSEASIRLARMLVGTPAELLGRKREGSLSVQAVQAVAFDEADLLLCAGAHGDPALEDELTPSAEGEWTSAGERGEGRRLPQFLLTTATLSDADEKLLTRRFPFAARVSQTGDLVPTLKQRFHYFRGSKDEQLLKAPRSSPPPCIRLRAANC